MFYTIKIETSTAGEETRDLRQFTAVDDAIVRFHSDLAKYIGNTKHILEMVIDENGSVLERKNWFAPETSETVTES